MLIRRITLCPGSGQGQRTLSGYETFGLRRHGGGDVTEVEALEIHIDGVTVRVDMSDHREFQIWIDDPKGIDGVQGVLKEERGGDTPSFKLLH